MSALLAGCGKTGPPLPPLVRIPAPPADFTAEKRGDRVELQFTVPAANTDNSKPANVERVDVYGFTGAATVNDADLLKYGALVGSVDVKAPKDPNEVVDPEEGESEADVDAPAGPGLDQGARATVEEKITPDAFVVPRVAKSGAKAETRDDGPLLGPPTGVTPTRMYVGVGITTRGRKGALSKRVAVPLFPAPPPPGTPKATYTESGVDVTWPAATSESAGVLPSHAIGEPVPTFGYNVYQLPGPDAKRDATDVRLTKEPIAATTFNDPRVTWGETRCYAVRAVEKFAGTIVESEPAKAECVTLADTFPPAPPKGLTAVASEGSISLIWEPNAEKDLAGYVVLRGVAPGETLTRVSPGTITETTFKDNVQPGVRFVYAVQAVDKAGNVSPASAKVEETAR